MNRKIIVFLSAIMAVSLLISSCSDRKLNFPPDTIVGFDVLQEAFKQPSKEYGTIPFFVWNDKMTREGIDEKMKDFKNAGCGGVIVHPRPGLITEYLSQEWFDLFQYTVEKGKELDMNVWIYDENSYPSGFAGGHVPAQMPESYNQGQGLKPFETNVIPADYQKYFLILKETNGTYRDITAHVAEETGKTGSYILFEKTYYHQSGWFGGFSYVDLLYPGVTEKFLEVTMPGYEKIAGDDFGKTVPGVFTDEPEISSPGGFRWTPDLFDVFKQQWGYELKENLPSLYKQVGNWKKVRHNYTKTLLCLFIERWSKPASQYYGQRGLKFTGHYWEHGWPSMQLGGDNMAMYAYHSVPGIDMLFNQFDEVSPNAQFGNIRSVKELASVANQMGRTRKLSETYGGAGWEVTFKDLKRLGDWEYALGVNLMNQHLSFSTIAGARKYDYPPSFSYHNPWWKSYSHLNNYFARLSLALSSGVQRNNILVIEPTTTAWLYDSYMKEGRYETLGEVGNQFQRFVTTIEKAQLEYDLGSEDIIGNHGKIERDRFRIGSGVYHTVVIPPLTENLDRKTFDLLKEYVRNGGKLIVFSKPALIDGDVSEEASAFFNQDKRNVVSYENLNEEVSAMLAENQDMDFEVINGGNLFHHRRTLQDGQLVFLSNADLNEKTEGSFNITGKDVLLMNAFTGEIVDYPETSDDGVLSVSFSLDPAESLLLYISTKKMKGFKSYTKRENLKEVQSGSEIVTEKKAENALMIDFCDLKTEAGQFKGIHVDEAAQNVYKLYGFEEGNPWNHSVQYKTAILDKENFPANSGFEASYFFTVNDEFDWSGLRLVVERPGLWSVSVNGNMVQPVPGKWWLDQSFGVFDAGKWIKKGENKVTLDCKPMKIHAEIEPVYLLGEFTLAPATKGWSVKAPHEKLKTGSWRAQGLPFYSWDMAYRRDFKIVAKSNYYEVGLGEWVGTVAEVYVNGKHAGTISLPTDRIPVTDLIKEGDNQIEVAVTGSLKNLLGPHHNNPAPGLSSPWHWRNIRTYPSGDQYQLIDYGLIDNIYLYFE